MRAVLWNCLIPRQPGSARPLANYTARPLQVQVFRGGELVYKRPALQEIQRYCLEQVDTLWDEVKRFEKSSYLLRGSVPAPVGYQAGVAAQESLMLPAPPEGGAGLLPETRLNQ